MTGMIAQLLAWPTLGVALLVFGFAPGVVLRLIVLLYPRGNPRRQELLGELYAVPRIERPFWVAEQLEVALFEGLRGRYRAWLNRTLDRMIDRMFRRSLDAVLAPIQTAASDDPFASLLADDIARGWRGRGWRGARPEMPPKEDHDPPAGV